MLAVQKSNRIALSLIFLIHGLISGLWFSHIPWVQARVGITNSELSLAILASTLGSFPGLLFAGTLTSRLGSRAMIGITAVCYCVLLPLIFLAPSLPLLALMLFFNGLFLSCMDVAMNSRASATEIAYGKNIMSSFHAFWSIAGLLAAGAAKVAFGLGWNTHVFITIAAALFLAAVFYALGLMKTLPGDDRKPAPQEKHFFIPLPKGPLITVALVVLLAFVSEGAVYDWGALFLNKVRGLDVGTAALGYGGFSFLMALGRIFGDSVSRRWGKSPTVTISSIFAALCLGAAVLIPVPWLSLSLLALSGLGFANIVPILFSVAGTSGVMESSRGIAAVSMIGYGGFMIGPPLMGFVADSAGLDFTMLLIVSVSVIIALGASFLLKPALARTVEPAPEQTPVPPVPEESRF